MWKDGKTLEQVASDVLRSYLVRCHRIVAAEYPEVAGMTAEHSADYLMHLRETGRITIGLYNKDANRIGCKITNTDGEDSPA